MTIHSLADERGARIGHEVIALCAKHGNKARDVRDAAHEAFHALYVNARDWDREKVHAKLKKRFDKAGLWIHEMQARAVEQLVCRHYGIDAGELDGWVFVSIREAVSHRLPFGEFDVSLQLARQFMDDPRARLWVNEIVKKASKFAGSEARV